MDIGNHYSFIYVCTHAHIHIQICAIFCSLQKEFSFYKTLIKKIILSINIMNPEIHNIFLKAQVLKSNDCIKEQQKGKKKNFNPLGYKQKVESMKEMQSKSSECQNDPP